MSGNHSAVCRLRWWVARKLAPVPVTAFPEKGAAIIAIGEGAWITLRFTKVRLRSTIDPIPQTDDELRAYVPSKRRHTFVGIAEDR